MKIKKVLGTGIENWFICTGKIKGRIVCGYGTTITDALMDAFRDYQVIEKL